MTGELIVSRSMVNVELFPPLDTQTLAFDVNREMRRTLVDLIRGRAPTTIMGVLLSEPEGVTTEAIADRLGANIGVIHLNVEKLESEDLCVRVALDGLKKVVPLAGYSDRNE